MTYFKNYLIHLIILLAILFFQAAFIQHITIFGGNLDVVFIVFVCSAYYVGPVPAQIIGFLTGLTIDSIGLSPMGFHAGLYALVGYFIGSTKGKMVVEPLFVPALLVLFATLFKSFYSSIVLHILSISTAYSIFSSSFAIELLVNILITPFIFTGMRIIKIVDIKEYRRL